MPTTAPRRPTRIYHTYPRFATLFTTLAMLYANYEIYRTVTGTHPLFSPQLQALGALQRAQQQEAAARSAAGAVEQRRVVSVPQKQSASTGEEGEQGWTSLNGIPLPTLGLLMRPWRRD